MNYKLLNIFFVLFILDYADCFSQLPDSAKNNAKYYYDSEEYQLAIPLFTVNISENPNDYKSFMYRGNCYLELGQNNKAIPDYLSALKINESSDLYYNLGNAYERLNLTDSSIYYFLKFTELEPEVPDGYNRLCIIYMYSHPEWGDTAIYYASQAVRTEPGNTVNLNYLALAYFSAGHYSSSLETALIGLVIDSTHSLLNKSAGISSFYLRDYTSAISFFERAYKYNQQEYTLLDYKIQSVLLKNTSPENIRFSSGQRILLNDISSETLKKTEEKIIDPNGKYYYKRLIQKFRITPFDMSLDEYFMLYFGNSFQDSYKPYHKSSVYTKTQKSLLTETNELEELLLKNPADFPLYLSLSDNYLELGDEKKYFENRFKYFGFIESIKATGDGLSAETAFVVNDVSHEYSVLISFGYRAKSQRILRQKRHTFDVVSVSDENDTEFEIFFNIDRPLSKLPKSQKN